ncbi:hypothetical protein FRC19_002208 [Serendipita sp. 401]|nr:hypothetical protein FRC16_008554 [Serendipita sp. 398]KAG8824216.1 hypothetical protein FRC19_002208 [Serendipita sp. 401]KAG8872606.1 hypothetical protein FRC20_009266 [Serendipita sp. 405]KAG9054234.1 hypothetical protein FS842_005723 [Serendipita sp. 407]
MFLLGGDRRTSFHVLHVLLRLGVLLLLMIRTGTSAVKNTSTETRRSARMVNKDQYDAARQRPVESSLHIHVSFVISSNRWLHSVKGVSRLFGLLSSIGIVILDTTVRPTVDPNIPTGVHN